MSKIFEALHKGRNQIEELLPPLNVPIESKSSIAPSPIPAPVAAIVKTPEPEAPAEPQKSVFPAVRLRPEYREPVLPFENPGAAGEQYRVLRTKIVQHGRHPRMLLVSSAGSGDGKSITAINLAGVLSLKNDGAIILVDGDFRRPSVARHLGIPKGPGLANVLAGEVPLQGEIVQIVEYPNLYVLQAGEAARNPTELLDTDHWKRLAEQLRRMFKYVVLDSPPIAAVADYDLLLAVSDGVVMVIRPDHTKRQACMKALNSIPPEKRLGVVMNWLPDWFLARSQGYSAYGYDGYY